MNFKPMEYKAKGSFEVLADDNYKGYRFFIISYGTHPCAYVALPKTSKFYGKYYEDRIFDDLNIHVHGGLTYSGMGLKGLLEEKAYLIGWDYAHYRDFTGYAFSNPFFLAGDEKKWSTEEIFEEVKDVIDEIIKEEADND